MGWPVQLLTIYCALIATSAFVGGVLPSLLNLTHQRMQYLVSLIGGLMLGVSLFHQLPHAVASLAIDSRNAGYGLDWCIAWMMAGLLATFFMLRMFHFHYHEAAEPEGGNHHQCDHSHDTVETHGHDSAGLGNSLASFASVAATNSMAAVWLSVWT